jgi:hypothetical protein
LRLNPVTDELVRQNIKIYPRTYISLLGVVALAALITAPGSSITPFLLNVIRPNMLDAVLISSLIAASILMILSTSSSYGKNLTDADDWLVLATLKPEKILWGRLLFSFLHSTVLVFLFSPYFFLAAGLTQLSIETAFISFFFLALHLYTWNILLNAMYLLLESRFILLPMSMWALVSSYYLLTSRLGIVNPVIAALDTIQGNISTMFIHYSGVLLAAVFAVLGTYVKLNLLQKELMKFHRHNIEQRD